MAVLAMMLCIIAALSIVVMGHPSQLKTLNPPLAGYKVIPMKWTGAITAGGNNVTIEGTIQDVLDEIRRVEPDFTWKPTTTLNGVPLKRQWPPPGWNHELFCNVGGDGEVPYADASSEASSMDLADGRFSVGPGPRVCSRASCKNNVGFWICNDQSQTVEFWGAQIASYVGEIIGRCDDDTHMVQGQVFDSSEWYMSQGIFNEYNVIVGKDAC